MRAEMASAAEAGVGSNKIRRGKLSMPTTGFRQKIDILQGPETLRYRQVRCNDLDKLARPSRPIDPCTYVHMHLRKPFSLYEDILATLNRPTSIYDQG
jgi:hypothetical protein